MTVLDQAQNFSGGVISAARQRDRWARKEANATDDELREQYREAIADLEARYPDIADVPVGGAEAFARERGHGKGSRSPVHEGRRRSGAGAPARTAKPASSRAKVPPAAQGKPRQVPGLTPGARRSPSQRKAAKGSPTPRVDRAIRRTGIPAALDSSGSVAMAALGGTVGLGLFYLVLSSTEQPGSGAAAVPGIIKGVTGFLHRFLSLEDLLPATGPSTQAELRSTSGIPTYNEGPGSNVAKAAARLRRAGGPSIQRKREQAARNIQQHAQTKRVGGTHR